MRWLIHRMFHKNSTVPMTEGMYCFGCQDYTERSKE